MFSTLHEALEHNRQTQNPTLDLGKLGLNGTEPELEQLKDFEWIETLIFSNEWREFDVEKKKWIEQKSQNTGEKNKLTYLPALPPQTKRLICAGEWNNKFEISDFSFLKDLQNIQTLSLHYNQISDISPLKDLQNIQTLDLSSNQISDISPLKDLQNIQTLSLSSNPISDISPLKDLQNIQTLDLSSNQISDISPLKDLQNIQSLDLRYNQISDISPLKDLQNIQSLDLRYNQISDISPLKDLQNIQSLYLRFNQISDISPLKDLQNIQSLDLISNQISDISPLKDLQNIQTLYLISNQISDISPLKDLQNIQSLDLSSNQISDISPLKDLQNIQSLDLSENQISDISPLKDLQNIQTLYLISNPISDISPLKDLQNIQSLSLSSNQISDISPLKDLQNIQSLDLFYNQISDISPLKDLQNIQSLYLRFNQISDISPLKDLQNIQSLDLRSNQISDISPLKDLLNIQTLHLSYNQISDITPLKDLQNIQSLDLSSNQISDISPLKDLLNIQTLMLWKNQISDISPLKDLQNIQTLDLSSNQISDISPLKDLLNIQTLDLRSNQISDISPLKDLLNIQTLDLISNQISDISLVFLNNFPKLEKLYLYKNPIQNIPQEVFDKEDNVLPEVLAYLRAQAQGEIINTEAKAVCFGNGEVGKTTLSHQLRMGAFSAEVGKDKTHGILIKEWTINIKDLPHADNVEQLLSEIQEIKTTMPKAEQIPFLQNKIQALPEGISKKIAQNFLDVVSVYWNKPEDEKSKYDYQTFPTQITLKLWDFGGQEYYHATHRLFLNHNVLYLLVWDKATNRQDEAQGIYPLAYWRENIQHYAPENITIEIQNKVGAADEATIKPQALQYKVANYYEDQDEYENDIKKLKKAIFNQLHRLKHLGKTFPKVYDDIRQVLRRQEEPFLPFAEYVALCEANDFTEDKIMREAIQIETLTNFLHETGAIICYRFKKDIAEALREYVFLRPAWVTDYIYEILAKELQGKGEFDLTHIAQKTTDSGISPDVWAELMQQFELIFEIEKTDEETEEKQKLYVAPQYLPTECTEKKAMRMAFKDKIISPVFTLQYPDFMPKSNFLRFVAKYGAQSVDYLYWKNGIVFFLAGKTVFAECRQVERQITIQIQDKDTYLAYQIFQTLYTIDSSEKLEVSVNGQDFVNYKELKDCKFEGLTYAGKDFEKKDFAFLFGEMQGKTNFVKNKPEPIMPTLDWKFIDKKLSQGDLPPVFVELEKIVEYLDFSSSPTYYHLKRTFEGGFINADFQGRLTVFLNNKDLRQKFPQTVPSQIDSEQSNPQREPEPNNEPKPELQSKIKILMLTANPAGTTELNIPKEVSAMQYELQNEEHIRLKTAHNLDYAGIMREVLKDNYKPNILHFSGHGTTSGIMLQNDTHNDYEVIKVERLQALFEYFCKTEELQFKVVILNACHSQEQADAISKYVKYVIGTTKAIADTHAIEFSKGFYLKLAQDSENIKRAFGAGKTLAVGKGANPNDFVLIENPNL